jgi:hypothetical protein
MVGGVVFSLHQGAKCLDTALKDSNKQWAEKWFMVANPALSLPSRTGYPPILNEKWEKMPSEDEMVQVRVLLVELSKLKVEKLTGAAMALSFSKRLTQPIHDRVGIGHPG